MVLIQGSDSVEAQMVIKFPSPCGDYGSYQRRKSPKYTMWKKGFPSPCGDYGSYRHGLWHWLVRRREAVSVPLRGLWFLSNLMNLCATPRPWKFPSPCGDYGSYLKLTRELRVHGLVAFPSPCGDYGSYLYVVTTLTSRGAYPVSVPLRGLWFLSRL